MPRTRFKRPFWFIMGALALLVLLGGSSAVLTLVRYTARNSSACRPCHPQIFELWKTSKGHPAEETSCFGCHAGVHMVVPSEYLADDDLTSQRCLDCHQVVLDYGYVIKKKIIKFSHRQHIHEGQDCVDCHRSAGHEYMTDGTNRPTINHCQDCHFREFEGPPKSQKCLNCHDVLLSPGKE